MEETIEIELRNHKDEPVRCLYRRDRANMPGSMREVKHADGYNRTREEILEMIWDMEEEIMGRAEESA